MGEVLLIISLAMMVVIALLQLMLLRRKSEMDLSPITQSVREEIASNRRESGESQRQSREELARSLQIFNDSVLDQVMKLTEVNERKLETLRQSTEATLKGFGDSMVKTIGEVGSSQRSQLGNIAENVAKLTDSNEKKIDGLKIAIETKLNEIRQDNTNQLEKMRATVDEKLQGTLEKRLGEAFKQVSERLEAVSKGLGEMQQLATGVGDLKKVLSNVKVRGTFGEVQLGAMLEQVLSPDQYERNVTTKDDANRVEYAVKLPGRDGDEVVWLPIDVKWPVEDYQRLLDAQEKADPEAAEAAIKQLEIRIKAEAKDICEKYVSPPKTTDFGIMFLPTEGLFAEVMRRTALTEHVQKQCKVVIAGPTTLWAILNSLHFGFRTLAIQKRSSEVWNLLGAVKTEWTKYGEVLDKVQKKLGEASNTIEAAQVRTRAIDRQLRKVQELPVGEAAKLLDEVEIEAS